MKELMVESLVLSGKKPLTGSTVRDSCDHLTNGLLSLNTTELNISPPHAHTLDAETITLLCREYY